MDLYEMTVLLGTLDAQCSAFETNHQHRDDAYRRLVDAMDTAHSKTAPISDEGDRAIRLDELRTELNVSAIQTEVWASNISMLNAAANAYKLSWNKSKYSTERAELRSLLEEPDEEPTGVRDVRNSFEHQDERIFKHFKDEAARLRNDSDHGRIHLSYLIVDDPGVDQVDALPDRNRIYGLWNASSDVMSFWDDDVDLRAVASHLRCMKAKIPAARSAAAHASGAQIL
ncbi:hypothetical protein [Klenkia soli]|uniref:hypothetical protein n=1 Tax=Klenkia soli TaxID=1052260 RepID=UPI00104225A1|nr:hypothetical protein [Klenkia soli]